MLSRVLVYAVLGLFLGLVAVSAKAEEKKDLVIDLVAQKVVTDAEGKEAFEPADKAKPGDVIEYTATYRNTGKIAVRDLSGTIPVPPGMEYLAGTARPAKVTASIDGRQYATVPLKRKVRLANGKEEVREIPAAEYRSLRWDLKELAAGRSIVVKARMQITDGAAAPTTDDTKN